jgi:hypothetical protein
VCLENAHRFARLHKKRLVAFQAAQLANYRVERFPRAGGAAGAAVDDEVLRTLGDLGVEVVHQHPHRRFLRPAETRDL